MRKKIHYCLIIFIFFIITFLFIHKNIENQKFIYYIKFEDQLNNKLENIKADAISNDYNFEYVVNAYRLIYFNDTDSKYLVKIKKFNYQDKYFDINNNLPQKTINKKNISSNYVKIFSDKKLVIENFNKFLNIETFIFYKLKYFTNDFIILLIIYFILIYNLIYFKRRY